MSEVTRRNFVTVSAIAGAGAVLAATGCSSESTAETTTQTAEETTTGTEGSSALICGTGEGLGKHGYVNVSVMLDGDTLKDIEITRNHETKGIGDVAMSTMKDLMIDSQTLNVDVIAGATLSSTAFISAVSEGLDMAGQSSSDWKGRDHAQIESPEYPTDVDVVVIGAGGAGYAAALTAQMNGASVLLAEKLGVTGGSTALSGGEMAVPGNWLQLLEGIEDSPEKMTEDMLTGGDNLGVPELVSVVANGALDASQWLTFVGGASWEDGLFQFGGHSIKRSLIPTDATGSTLVSGLDRRTKLNKLPVVVNTQATELIQTDGKVTGVKCLNTVTGDEVTINCNSVVIATGGFGSNVEFRQDYDPALDETVNSTSSVGATGDGIAMATTLGAKLTDMEYIQTYPNCDPQTGALLYICDMRFEGRGLMINKEGDRFVEELDRRDVLSEAIKAQTGGVAYMVFDQAGADASGLMDVHADEVENLMARNLMSKGDTLAEACELFEIDAEELQNTITRYDGFVDAGEDADFAYRGSLNKFDTAPYYIVEYSPAVHYCMGGLSIDTDACVLNEDGSKIDGLYAAGEVTGGIMGTNRLGSTSISDIFVFGRVAGNNSFEATEKESE